MKQCFLTFVSLGLCASAAALADEVDIPNQFSAGTAAVAAEVNENFAAVEVAVDDNAAQITTLSNTVDGNVSEITALSDSVSDLEAEVTALAAENASLTQLLQSLVLETSLYPAVDTIININQDSAQADSETLFIGDFGPFETYGLMQFDVSGVPAGAAVASAELRLWMIEDVEADLDLCIQRVTSAWDETVRFSTAPTRDTTCVATTTLEQQAGLYYWPGLEGVVQSWVDGGNFGLAIVKTGPDATSVREFYSIEGGIYKPELKIRYRPLP